MKAPRLGTRDSGPRTAGRGGYDGVFDDYILDKAILAWCWGVDGLLLFPGRVMGTRISTGL